jgi:D-alanyl-lipoteichoic acid acyltransferase DltB (MBOAT superfamily)
MDSASFQFLIFGLLAAVLSNFSNSGRWRSLVLLLTSIVFLGLLAHDPYSLVPLAGFVLLGYGGLRMLDKYKGKNTGWFVLAVIVAYVWLKKYTLLPSAIFLRQPYLTLGLSYIFFRVLHLLIEAGDGAEGRHIGFSDYLLYTLNFTTFVSGPIQRYDEFARDQFEVQPLSLGSAVIGLQLERVVRGFFKVNVLAMLLDALRRNALVQMSQPHPPSEKMAYAFGLAVVYPLFLYANFSGYIDIVVAIARLMRVRLPENFDRPFSASSFIDFWNRWHITLSAWLKTYVYNPLLVALMRCLPAPGLQPLLAVFSFFVTFFLIGIWHGRTSEFVIFGALQGGGVAINKLWQLGLARVVGRKEYKTLAATPVYIAFGRGLTYSWFAFTLFWFWADWKQIDRIFSTIGIIGWLGIWLALWLFATAVLALWEWLRAALLSFRTAEGPILTSPYARVIYASTMGLTALVIVILLGQPAPGLIYKAF